MRKAGRLSVSVSVSADRELCIEVHDPTCTDCGCLCGQRPFHCRPILLLSDRFRHQSLEPGFPINQDTHQLSAQVVSMIPSRVLITCVGRHESPPPTVWRSEYARVEEIDGQAIVKAPPMSMMKLRYLTAENIPASRHTARTSSSQALQNRRSSFLVG